MPTNKKIAIAGVAVIILGLLIWGGTYSYQNLRGARPAFMSPTPVVTQVTPTVPPAVNTTGLPLTVAKDFSISVFAKDLGDPRVLAIDPKGVLVVSVPEKGTVVAMPDGNADGVADSSDAIISNLNKPHGLAFHCNGSTCQLFVAETDKISVFDYDAATRKASNKKELVKLGTGGRHTTKTILIATINGQEKMLISSGSSCDVCNETDSTRAAISVMDLDGKNLKPYATGLRNSVFMTHNLVTGDVWATEMGRDSLGDNIPPDEINIIKQGGNYGWPICYGDNINDRSFDKNTYIQNPCNGKIPPQVSIPAHSAPLGIAFVPEEGWPEAYWYNAFVSYHGSWNRSTPTGYKIARVKLDAKGNYLGVEDFISGWLDGNTAKGRPVDIITLPGGTMYVSDDKAGVVYRIVYGQTVGSSAQGPVTNIADNQTINSPLTITGTAPGSWFFEGSFPVQIVDSKGAVVAEVPAKAQSDWMTSKPVQFIATLKFTPPAGQATGSIILKKDNPSGLPENDASVSIPITFDSSTSLTPTGVCQPGVACTSPTPPAEENILCIAESADGSCLN